MLQLYVPLTHSHRERERKRDVTLSSDKWLTFLLVVLVVTDVTSGEAVQTPITSVTQRSCDLLTIINITNYTVFRYLLQVTNSSKVKRSSWKIRLTI